MDDFSISDDDDFDGDFDFGASKHRFSGQPDFKSKGKTGKAPADDPYKFDLGDDPFHKPKGKQAKGKPKDAGKGKKQDTKNILKPAAAVVSGSALSRADGMLAKYSKPVNFVKAAPVKVSSEFSSSSDGGVDHMDDMTFSDDSLSPSKPAVKSSGGLVPPPLQPPSNPTLSQVVSQPKPVIQSALVIPTSVAFATKRPASFHESSMQELDSVLEEDIPDEVPSDMSGLSSSSPPPRASIVAAAAVTAKSLYAVGDRVEAAYGRGDQWYPGVITEVHSDGTCAVRYDDGDEDNGLTSQYIRRVPLNAPAPAPVKVSPPVKQTVVALPSVASVASEYSDDGFEKSSMGNVVVKAVGPVYAVGDRVECRYRGGNSWFAGKVTGCGANGTYSILYDDGDKEDGVSTTMIRKVALPPPAAVLAKVVAAAAVTAKSLYAVGDRVEAAYGRGDQWYPGVITEVHSDGTCAVRYDDGDEDNGLTPQYIRKSAALVVPKLSSANVVPTVPLQSARSDYSEDGFEKSTASASTKPPRSLKSELSPRFQPPSASGGIAVMGKSPVFQSPVAPVVSPQIAPVMANTSVVSEAYTEDFDNTTVVEEKPKVAQPPLPHVAHPPPPSVPQQNRVLTAVPSRFKSVATQTAQPDVCVSCGSHTGPPPTVPASYGYPYSSHPHQPGLFPVSTMPTVGTASAIMFQRMLAVMMDALQRPPQHQPQILYPSQLQPPGGEVQDHAQHSTHSSSKHGPRRRYSWRDVPITSSHRSRDVSPQSMQSRRSEGGSPPPIVGTSLYSRESVRDAWLDGDASRNSPHDSQVYTEPRTVSPDIPSARITGELQRLLTQQPPNGGDTPFQSARIPSLLSPAQAIASSASTLKLNLLNRSSDRNGDLSDAVAASHATTKTLYTQINQLRSRIRESRSVLESRQGQPRFQSHLPKSSFLDGPTPLPYSAKIDTALLLSKRKA